MTDYYSALKAWQSGRNDPGDAGAMPEGFRIRPALKRSAAHVAALEQVRGWTRARFNLSDEAAVMAVEVACRLPGCPPLETVVAFWDADGTRHQFKVFKRVEEVVEDDLPPGWLKSALIVDEDADFDCC
jgi:nitrate reductase delta subunit